MFLFYLVFGIDSGGDGSCIMGRVGKQFYLTFLEICIQNEEILINLNKKIIHEQSPQIYVRKTQDEKQKFKFLF